MINKKIGVQYYEDILARIPRPEIELYEKVFKKAVKDISISGTEFEIVGSYRRGNKTSGDIDVIVTNTNNNHKAFEEFLDKTTRTKDYHRILITWFHQITCHGTNTRS